jgi:hypothetical protein
VGEARAEVVVYGRAAMRPAATSWSPTRLPARLLNGIQAAHEQEAHHVCPSRRTGGENLKHRTTLAAFRSLKMERRVRDGSRTKIGNKCDAVISPT